MASLCARRLNQERLNFKKQRPFGYFARFGKKENGGQDIMTWHCGIKTRDSGPWKGAVLRVRIEFSEDFPGRPPKCVMEFLDKEAKETVFHPNIYPSGTVCLSILNEDKDWRPILTVVTILQGINDMMDNPNPNSPAQEEAFRVYEQDKDHLEWQKRVFDQATRIIEGKAYKHLAQVDGATSVRGAAAADGGSAASDKTGSTASSNGIR